MHATVDRTAPRWGWLYALAIALLAVFGAVDVFEPAGTWRRVVELTVTMILFAVIQVWVRANRQALEVTGAQVDDDVRQAAAAPAQFRQAEPGHRMVVLRGGGG